MNLTIQWVVAYFIGGPLNVETYSFVWKGRKENQECTNGDYCVKYYWINPNVREFNIMK